MPHDKKGRLIEVGDVVKAQPYNYNDGKTAVGTVVAIRCGQSCSGDFAFLKPYEGIKVDAFGADDAELILKADGSEPAPSIA